MALICSARRARGGAPCSRPRSALRHAPEEREGEPLPQAWADHAFEVPIPLPPVRQPTEDWDLVRGRLNFGMGTVGPLLPY